MRMTESSPSSRSDFGVAVVCALPDESAAVIAMFDRRWDDSSFTGFPNDVNEYSFGQISGHNVIVTHLPSMGTNSAAASVGRLCATFTNVELVLAVGICGGIPNAGLENIFLGDVIVSNSIVQYDLGSQYPHTFKRKDTAEDSLPRHGPRMLSFLHRIKSLQTNIQLVQNMHLYLKQVMDQPEFASWNPPSLNTDRLFDPSYRHKHQEPGLCDLCDACNEDQDETCEESLRAPCDVLGCSDQHATLRRQVSPMLQPSHLISPTVHFGTIASGNQVMKSAAHRDKIARHENAIAFEMEGAGIWESKPTLIIKGVSDYADSHKSKDWQRFACVTAASCMKAMLNEWNGMHHATQSRGVALEHLEQQERQAKDLVNALWFREIADRFDGIEEAKFESFRWIFDESASPLSQFDLQQAQRVWFPGTYAQSAIFQYARHFKLGAVSEWDPCGLKAWLRSGDGIFWITGKPGCGKSTMMKFIYGDKQYMDLLKVWTNGRTLLAPSFFSWRAGSEMQNNQLGFLQSILYQILESRTDIVPQILEPIELEDLVQMHATKQGSTGFSWTVERVKAIFNKLLRHEKIRLCILLDGLDEMKWAFMDMVDYLLGLVKHKNVKILASGRYLPEFSRPFQSFNTIRLHEWTLYDIDVYIRGRLLSNEFLRQQSEEFREDFEHLIGSILNKAEGVFIWVRTAVTELIEGIYKADSIQELRQRLDALPPEIFDLYEMILYSQDKRYTNELRHLLSLVWAAVPRRLSFKIFTLAACYEREAPDWILLQSRMDLCMFQRLQAQTRRRLESICSQFIHCQYSSQTRRWDVGFMHKTVFDFFKSPKLQSWLYEDSPGLEYYAAAIHIADFTLEFAFQGKYNHPEGTPGIPTFVFSRILLKNLARFPPFALQQLDAALLECFGNNKEFILLTEFRLVLEVFNTFTAPVSAFFLQKALTQNQSGHRLVTLAGLLMNGLWAKNCPTSFQARTQALTVEDRTSVLIIDTFWPTYAPDEPDSPDLRLAPRLRSFFDADSNSIGLCWLKIVSIVNCQASVPSGSFRYPGNRFFPSILLRLIESFLQLGADVNVLVQCSIGESRTVLQSPLRVFRRCEEFAKTIKTFSKTKHSWTPGEAREHVRDITAIIQLLLEYGAEDIEEDVATPVPQPEEHELTHFLMQRREESDAYARKLLASDDSGDHGYRCIDYWVDDDELWEDEAEVEHFLPSQSFSRLVEEARPGYEETVDTEDEAQALFEKYEDEAAFLEHYSSQCRTMLREHD